MQALHDRRYVADRAAATVDTREQSVFGGSHTLRLELVDKDTAKLIARVIHHDKGQVAATVLERGKDLVVIGCRADKGELGHSQGLRSAFGQIVVHAVLQQRQHIRLQFGRKHMNFVDSNQSRNVLFRNSLEKLVEVALGFHVVHQGRSVHEMEIHVHFTGKDFHQRTLA